MNEVIWTEPALAHLAAIRAYIGQFNPKAAQSIAVTLKAAGDSLARFPHRGRAVPGTTMRELVADGPYVIRYVIEGNRVIVLRVRHGARKPTTP